MPSTSFAVFCVILATLQFLAALPWIAAIHLYSRRLIRDWRTWGIGLGVCLLTGLFTAFVLSATSSNQAVLGRWGRAYMSALHLQLAADLFVLIFLALLTLWPKGGAVAQAAFREAVRQPMFWALTGFAGFLMLISIIIPYFTFGEDLKMVKEVCYAFTMLASLVFGVMSSAISVHEEIEGRTAITVMSKPISRRQFFLGKFVGILLSALAMTMILGWLLIWAILVKIIWDITPSSPQQNLIDPAWLTRLVQHFEAGSLADLMRGMGLWTDDALTAMPGLVQGFCQVMVLLAIATALATRLPMIVNVAFCLFIFFLGNLASIMVDATAGKYALLSFIAQVIQTVFPGLDHFDVSAVITRDVPLSEGAYAMYTLSVTLYALCYSTCALLFGLILFEDRDLA